MQEHLRSSERFYGCRSLLCFLRHHLRDERRLLLPLRSLYSSPCFLTAWTVVWLASRTPAVGIRRSDDLGDCEFRRSSWPLVDQYTLKGSASWVGPLRFIYCLCAILRLARFNCNVGVVSKNYFQGLPSPAAAALVCGFVWLGCEGSLPERAFSYPASRCRGDPHAGLTMGSRTLPSSRVRATPSCAIVVFSLLFIVISSNTSLSIFVLFCLYAPLGFADGFYCWWTGRPKSCSG